MSKNVSSYLILNEIIDSEEREVYEYSFELLLSATFSLIVLIGIAITTGTMFFTILYLIGFIPLRLVAGGYHAKNHFRCFLILMFVYSLFLLTTFILSSMQMTIVSLINIAVSILLVILFAPSEDKNKPTSHEEIVLFKRRSRFLIIGYAVFICALIILVHDIKISYSITMGVFTVSVSLLANYIKRKYNAQRGG